ncbi:hypothetical protein AMTR_s00086p00098920 [Amborella trichopoda]|uniref:Uncharacterized protein n=1 Tax=Amborella trichopoda TaxID=13333 RepID=W1P4F3_AMBTC|nr:hypothetical protein AMTR_s00086p00098920 [Amborella trichopoda]
MRSIQKEVIQGGEEDAKDEGMQSDEITTKEVIQGCEEDARRGDANNSKMQGEEVQSSEIDALILDYYRELPSSNSELQGDEIDTPIGFSSELPSSKSDDCNFYASAQLIGEEN